MSTYKQIQGTAVQNNAGNLENAAEGQLWYDSTNANFKFKYESATGAWSTGGSLNTARNSLAGAGTQTAALAFGGDAPSLGPGGGEIFAGTESYNGTSWTEVNDLNTARFSLAGVGTNTAALAFGGIPPPAATAVTESWNGTSWTEVNDLNTARRLLAGAGADNTSALGFGGFDAAAVAVTESWNGTSWTEVNDLNTARNSLAGAGTQTAALAFGGSPPVTAVTESWNGTSWTEVNDLNAARSSLGGTGTQTAALAFGGSPIPVVGALTESYNGTSWTEVNDLNTARFQLGGAGTNTSALAFGGDLGAGTPEIFAGTEEWNVPGTVVETITTS